MNIFKSLLFSFIILFSACNSNRQEKGNKSEISGDLIIFHAGSLAVPFKEVAKAFKTKYPEVTILPEAAGSRNCARKITDLHRDCDIMASADYTVIDNLLIPAHTNWNIKFASNEMTIVYSDKSRYLESINKDNWFEILLKEDVRFGRSDPNSDPCGYRAVLTSKLSEGHYGIPGLSERLLAKDQNFIRPKEVDLLALLESHTIDYIFLYRSVAEQHGLNFIVLPNEINLKNPEMKSEYAAATVQITGKKPGEFITKKGEPMVYGITILKNAPNKKTALKFVEFLLSEEGIKIMEKSGQPSLVPSFTETYKNIPRQLKKYAKK